MSARRGRGGGRATQDDEEASQSSQVIRSSGTMDPGQDLSDRRKIRRSYRELIQQTNDQKQEYIRPESNGLFEAIARGDDLYKEVRMPREAALDSEFLQVASQLGLEQTRRLHTGFKTYEVNDFVSRLRAQFLRGGDENEQESFSWMDLGKRVSPRFHSTPAVNFMYGPMSVEPPQKKERKKIVREKRGNVVRPEEVQDTQLDSGVETTHRVQDVLKHLQKVKSANFFHFVLDPSSFGQTVENIFHSAFLIRDGLAKLSDTDGAVNFEPNRPPTEEDYNSGKAHRKQCIVRFDWAMWEKMKSQNQGADQIIPHRKPGEYMHPGLKNNKNNDNNNNNNNHGEGSSSQPNGKGHVQKGKRHAGTKRGRKDESDEEEEEEEEEEVVNKKQHRSTPHPRAQNTTVAQQNGHINGTQSPLLDEDDEYFVEDSQPSANGKKRQAREEEDAEEDGSDLVDSRFQKRTRQDL